MDSHFSSSSLSRTKTKTKTKPTDPKTTTMAPLMKKIAKNIDNAVDDFCKQLATRFGLDATEISSLWKESQSAPGAKKNKGATKKSGYVMFGLEVRPLIGAEHPDWDFVAKSKEIGRRWTALSVEEKNRYKEMGIATATAPLVTAPVAVANGDEEDEDDEDDATQLNDVEEEPPVVPAPIKKTKPATFTAAPAPAPAAAPAPIIQDEYTAMSLKDLKNICKTRALKVSGKREELLDRIRNAPIVVATTATAPVVAAVAAPAPAPAPANDEEEEERFSDVGDGTPGSVGILPEGLEDEEDETDLGEMEEDDVAPEPIAPKKKHNQQLNSANAFPAVTSATAPITVANTKKPSGWNKLSTEDLRTQCDDWDIDFDEETPREELIRALNNFIH